MRNCEFGQTDKIKYLFITYLVTTVHVEVIVVLRVRNIKLLLGLGIHPCRQLVEDVEVPLLGILHHHAGFL